MDSKTYYHIKKCNSRVFLIFDIRLQNWTIMVHSLRFCARFWTLSVLNLTCPSYALVSFIIKCLLIKCFLNVACDRYICLVWNNACIPRRCVTQHSVKFARKLLYNRALSDLHRVHRNWSNKRSERLFRRSGNIH